MLVVSVLVFLQSFNLATAVCTYMSSPQNINTGAGNFTSPRWETPIPADDKCKWTVNIAGGQNVILRVDLRRIDTVSSPTCLVGGYLQMPDGSRECGQKNNQCFIYSYDTVTDEACQRAIAMSPCKYVKLEIHVWPPKFTYVQDVQGRSKGFSLGFSSSNCALTPLPTFGSTSTGQHTTPTSPLGSTDSTDGELTTVLSSVSSRTQATSPPITTGSVPTEQSTETTVASSKPPTINHARQGAVAVAIILALTLVIVLVVFLVRYMEHRRKSAMDEPFASDYSRPEVGIYEAAHDVQTQSKAATILYDDGYDDSELKGRPTPVPRSGATRLGSLNPPTGEGYDDIRLRPSDDDHHYEEVGLHQNGFGGTMRGQTTEVDAYSYDE